MTELLLTGAGGRLGQQILRSAAAAGLALEAAPRTRLDLCDREAVKEALAVLRPAVVINAAAYTAVDRAEEEPDAAQAANRHGPANLAEACAETGAALIHLSTDYVFGGLGSTPCREEDVADPLNVYGASKLAGERLVAARLERHLILRTAWLYGSGGGDFVATMLRHGRAGEPLPVVADRYGSPTERGDLARAILTLARRLRRDALPTEAFGTFHCAGAGGTSWYGFARRIFELAEPRPERRPALRPIAAADYPAVAARPTFAVLDCSRLARVHGLALRPWEQALAALLAPDPGPLGPVDHGRN